MRSATSGELAALLAVSRTDAKRVWVADHTDTLQDVTADVLSCQVVIDVNAPGRTAQVVLHRNTSSGSRSPFIGANPSIYAGRRVFIEAAVKAAPGTIGSSDWVPLFDGFVARPDFGTRDSRVILPCIDSWSVLVDTWLKTTGTYGSDSSPVAIGTVIQQLVDAAVGSSVYTLTTLGTPTTTFVEYEVRPTRCADALIQVINKNGWDLRFWWIPGSPGSFELTLQQPPRSKTTPDYIFTADGYFDVPTMALDPASIVNSVGVEWQKGTTEVRQDSTSIAAWGEKYAPIDATNDPQISDATLAAALGDVVVADKANPLTLAAVRCRLNPFLEIWDLVRLPADDTLHDSDLDLAVSKVTHTWPERGAGSPSTTLELSGAPSGGVDRWERLIRPTEATGTITRVTGDIPTPAPEATVAASFDTSGNLSAMLDGKDVVVKSWKVLGAIGTPPTKTAIEAETAIDGTALTEADIGTLATASGGGEIGYVGAIGYSQTGGAGIATAVIRDLAMFGTSEAGIPDDSIGAAKIKDGAVAAAKQTAQAMSFTCTVRFSAPAYNTIDWEAGAVYLADGTTTAISANGAPINVGTPTFIYYDGTSLLKTTTTAATLQDDDVLLICTAWASVETTAQANFVSAVGVLGSGGEKNMISADQIAVNAITANAIQANAVTAAKINVTSLSAIVADLGTVTAGTISAGVIVAATNFTAATANFDGNISVEDAIIFTDSGGTIFADIDKVGTTNRGMVIAPDTGTPVTFGATIGLAMSTLGRVEFHGDAILGGSGDQIGFYGASGIIKPTITGSRGSNAALASLLTELEGMGLITDSST